MKKVVYIVILSLGIIIFCAYFYLSREQNTIKYKITHYCTDSIDCTIRLIDVTSFEWDTLYVFSEYIENENIENILNKDFNFTYAHSSKYIYIFKNKITYIDEIEDNISKPIKYGDYLIVIPKHTNCLLFTPNNAIFKLSNEYSKNTPYLYPIAKHIPYYYLHYSDPEKKNYFISIDSLID